MFLFINEICLHKPYAVLLTKITLRLSYLPSCEFVFNVPTLYLYGSVYEVEFFELNLKL